MSKLITPDDYIFGHANTASSEIYKSVCTLFSYSEGSFKMEGSGLLFLFNEEPYIVSASHVFDSIRTLYMPINNNITVIEGGLWCGDPTKSKEEHKDIVDIAVFKIEQSYKLDILNSYKALTEKDIAVNHIENNKSVYLMVANTGSKTKFDRISKTVKTQSFSYVGTHVEDKIYIENNFDKKYFLTVNYDRKRIKRGNTYIQGPLPFGMSGSGLWLLDNIWENESTYKLVGILVEYRERTQIVVALRSFVLTELLRQRFDIDFPERNAADFSFV